MKKIVKIGNKEVEVVANAASPYLYKGLFREDFLLKIQDKELLMLNTKSLSLMNVMLLQIKVGKHS